MKTISRIREFRKRAGITQEELAQLLGVSRPAVAQWERGINNPRADMLIKLANLFKCSIDDLLYH